MSKVSVHIVTWNSERFIENALASLDAQTFRDFSVLIVDNGSTDQTLPWLREHYPQVKIVENRKNLGFSKAHNQAIHFTKSDYVFVMNVDVILKEDYLKKLVTYLNNHSEVGSLTGKTYRLQGSPKELSKDSFTRIIDNVGLRAYKSRRFTECGAGEQDQEQYDEPGEVFGVSGALGFYRRKALEDIRIRNEYFDENFFFYKEDVDLAWRLRLAGWLAYYLPEAIAYHHRGVRGDDSQGNVATFKNRFKKPDYSKIPSYRNHLCLLVKNERSFWRHALFILWYELRKFVYILLFEQKTLKGLGQFFKLLPTMRRKRTIIKEKARLSAQEMRKWFG